MFQIECVCSSPVREKITRGLVRRFKREGRHWTKTRVVRALRKRARNGEAMNRVAVEVTDGALEHAIVRLFGSWSDALRAAGFDPSRYRKLQAWDRERVVEALGRRYRKGDPMNLYTAGAMKANRAITSHEGRTMIFLLRLGDDIIFRQGMSVFLKWRRHDAGHTFHPALQ